MAGRLPEYLFVSNMKRDLSEFRRIAAMGNADGRGVGEDNFGGFIRS